MPTDGTTESTHRLPRVFVFNPLSEGYIAEGMGFTPVKHQAQLAADLANLPQYLCREQDIVLVEKLPSSVFLQRLAGLGFRMPQFIELVQGQLDLSGPLGGMHLGGLRPWAWGPDSVRLLRPLFPQVVGGCGSDRCYHQGIAQLYSKAWSAALLRRLLEEGFPGLGGSAGWLCTKQEAGVMADSLVAALSVVEQIRKRGHHRVVIKEAHGLAGHNAIRLWEPEVLPAQRRWLSRATEGGRQVVVEPWLEREVDFSVQLEMGVHGLTLCGFTGLVNDLKGQFQSNWAAPDFAIRPPAEVCLRLGSNVTADQITRLYLEAILPALEAELGKAEFQGPISVDAFIYRGPDGGARLKPVVEINPRYTMGRVLLELMTHACPGSSGRFCLVNRAHARAQGFADLCQYARSLEERKPVRLETTRIREGATCLNDPVTAQACLATFEIAAMAA